MKHVFTCSCGEKEVKDSYEKAQKYRAKHLRKNAGMKGCCKKPQIKSTTMPAFV